MSTGNFDPDRRTPQPWQPRFGLGAMLLVMFVCSVMAAAGYYFMQTVYFGRQFRLAFILFTLAAPLLFAVALSIARSLILWVLGRNSPS